MGYNKENKKEYYEKNKDNILKLSKQKIKCECGCIVCKYGLKRHKKTWDHHYFNGTLDEYYNSS